MSGLGSAVLGSAERGATLLAAVNAPVARTGRNLSAALIGAMVALALAQILSRSVFDYTLDWAEELARVALVWSVLLVAPFAYRSGAHVAIDSLAASLPPRLIIATSLALNCLVLWICAEMFRQSLAFWSRGLALTASALGVQMAWIYAIVPTAFALLILVGLELVLRLAVSLARPDPELTLAGTVPAVKPREH